MGLLLKGGISTSNVVTEVAGRGIGLDVVREMVGRLGGEAVLRSEPARGATLEIVVPVSLTSLDVLIVDGGGHVVGIPLDAVRETLRVSAADVTHTAAGRSIVHDGKVIPFAPLARSLRSPVAPRTPRAAWSAAVIDSGGVLAAVGVDRLLGTENVVLRQLPDLVPDHPLVAGASLDPEGNPQVVLDPAELVVEVRRAEATTTDTPTKSPPILVIDDSLTTRMLEQSILESAGYEVDLAVSGEEALEKAHQRRYGLFLVDVEMPGMDGFTFIERSRALPETRDVPAILVTSRAAPEDVRRGEAVGASAHVVKSEFDQNELLARIRKLVG
jgi:two-component system chemotaxis sensor kinase CheA